MEETFEQKIFRNIQGKFAVYKTSAVVGEHTAIPNIEWIESEEVDKFFMFATNLGAKVIYIAEGEEIDENTGQAKSTIVQIGFIHQGIMHHINLIEDEEEYDEEETEDEFEYVNTELNKVPEQGNSNNQFIGQ